MSVFRPKSSEKQKKRSPRPQISTFAAQNHVQQKRSSRPHMSTFPPKSSEEQRKSRPLLITPLNTGKKTLGILKKILGICPPPKRLSYATVLPVTEILIDGVIMMTCCCNNDDKTALIVFFLHNFRKLQRVSVQLLLISFYIPTSNFQHLEKSGFQHN